MISNIGMVLRNIYSKKSLGDFKHIDGINLFGLLSIISLFYCAPAGLALEGAQGPGLGATVEGPCAWRGQGRRGAKAPSVEVVHCCKPACKARCAAPSSTTGRCALQGSRAACSSGAACGRRRWRPAAARRRGTSCCSWGGCSTTCTTRWGSLRFGTMGGPFGTLYQALHVHGGFPCHPACGSLWACAFGHGCNFF